MELLGIKMSFKEFDKLICEQNKGKELKVVDNKVVAIEKAITEEEELEHLRTLRKTNCFSIINRGQLWYQSLKKEELDELEIWYKNWLDVTKTKIIPQNPYWLDIQ